jgi:hypothetical protein
MPHVDDVSSEDELASNQALFREVNERISELVSGFDLANGLEMDLVCECSDTACTLMLRVPVLEYERVRRHPARFLIHPRHDVPQIEKIVGAGRGYEVVEKLGEAARVVADDPLHARSGMASGNDHN